MSEEIDSPEKRLTSYLRDRGKATNKEMIDVIGGDRKLFERVRETLILDAVAGDDADGVGLVYIRRPLDDADVDLASRVGIEPTKLSLRVFVSYGHDSTAPIAKRLARDLKLRGHVVWLDDSQLRAGSDWENSIENGLEWVGSGPDQGVMILLMTPHSVRRPDGYCLNEVTLAISRRIRIVPVMLVDVEPPLSIARIQWLDFRDCIPIDAREACYERKLPALLAALEDNSQGSEGTHARLFNALRPISYDKDIEYHLPRFTGRTWLFREIQDWLDDPHGSAVFWLSGSPGMGKSAIAAWLCTKRPEVVAFHFCRFSSSLKADPAQAVRSIAWQLSTQLPDYFARLTSIPNLEEACDKGDAATLFDLLIIQPLHNLSTPDHVLAIVIDALDEATRLGRNELARFLADEAARLPGWMRLIVTSRPEIEVTRYLQPLDPMILTGSPDNTDDIVEYIQTHIAPYATGGAISQETLAVLLDTSEENWLYISWIQREVQAGRLSLSRPESFPRGLGGVFSQFFDRGMPNVAEYTKRCRPFLELVVAACEPPLTTDLARVLQWSSYELNEVFREFGSLLNQADRHVRMFHRSLQDWLIDPAQAGEYMVDPLAGHRTFAVAGWAEFSSGVANMSDYMKRWLPEHLFAAGRQHELAVCITDARFIGEAFAEGRHLDLARFWGTAGSSEFAHSCEVSFDRLGKEDDPEALLASARGLGQLFLHCGSYDRAIYYFERVLTTALAGGDASTIGFSYLDISWCYRNSEEYDSAIAHADQAVEYFRTAGNRGGWGRAESIKGICLWHQQHDLSALEHLDSARRLGAEAGDDRAEAEALNHSGIVRRSIGQYEDALECLHSAQAFYTKVKDLRGLGKCCNSLGTAYWWSKQYDRALEYYQKADQYNDVCNQHYVAGLTANNLGYLFLETGQNQKALDSFVRSRNIRRRLRIKGYEMIDLSGLALAHHALGNTEKARRLSAEALNGLQSVKNVEDEVRAYYNHYVIMTGGSPEEAESAANALAAAKRLVAERVGQIDEPHARSEFIARVPLIRELVV
jgi:tetratricopeptide (TPR) repeat protein